MKPLRVAVIGCGMIAGAKHLPAIMRYRERWGGVELVSLCGSSRSPHLPARLAARFGLTQARLYSDYLQMLERENPDAVHICSSNRTHGPMAMAALRRGISVLCEKPMAVNRFEAREMLRLAENSGAVLMIAYQNRFRPDVQRLKGICAAGELGEIYYGKAMATRRRGVPNWGRFLDRQEQGGGALMDLGCHALDMTLWLMDDYDVKSVLGTTFRKIETSAAGRAGNSGAPAAAVEGVGAAEAAGVVGTTGAVGTVEEAATAMIVMKNGHSVFLEASWAMNMLDTGESRCTLCGTKAGADMKRGLRINGVENHEVYTTQIVMDTSFPGFYDGELPETHFRETENFYQSILGRAETVVKAKQSLVVTEIIDAIYASAERGVAIDMSGGSLVTHNHRDGRETGREEIGIFSPKREGG